MPSAPARLCREPGCGAFAIPGSKHGRCTGHTTAVYGRIERYRGTAKARGYDADWRRVRNAVLHDQPFCVACNAAGVVQLAQEVDHVVPLAHGGARLERQNLQGLCREHHAEKTAAENAQRRRA
jgi:5-methylcytosine-specific restriction protein A